MDGTWESNQFWGGWKDGVVDLAPIADFVPEDIRAAAEEEAERFASGEETIYTIFTGPLADQTGEERVHEGQAMTDEELLGMNWFVEGVDGEIPS
jgi:basic membrane protein A and related proteins